MSKLVQATHVTLGGEIGSPGAWARPSGSRGCVPILRLFADLSGGLGPEIGLWSQTGPLRLSDDWPPAVHWTDDPPSCFGGWVRGPAWPGLSV
jgi:hypothetical protein